MILCKGLYTHVSRRGIDGSFAEGGRPGEVCWRSWGRSDVYIGPSNNDLKVALPLAEVVGRIGSKYSPKYRAFDISQRWRIGASGVWNERRITFIV